MIKNRVKKNLTIVKNKINKKQKISFWLIKLTVINLFILIKNLNLKIKKLKLMQ